MADPIAEPRPFSARHIGTGSAEQQVMLKQLGYPSLDALVAAAVPELIRSAARAAARSASRRPRPSRRRSPSCGRSPHSNTVNAR